MKKFYGIDLDVSVSEDRGAHTSVGVRYRTEVYPSAVGFPAYEPALLPEELSEFTKGVKSVIVEGDLDARKPHYIHDTTQKEPYVLTQVTILNSVHSLMRSIAIKEYGYDLHHALSTGVIRSSINGSGGRLGIHEYKEYFNRDKVGSVVSGFLERLDSPPKPSDTSSTPYMPYHVFTQKKKSGGFRVLHSPTKQMSHLQGKLLVDLYRVTNMDKTFSQENMSYLPGKSFVNVIRDKKLKQQFELSVDLKNYYHQIHGSRVATAMLYAPSNSESISVSSVLANVRTMLLTALSNAFTVLPGLNTRDDGETYTGMSRAVTLACIVFDAYAYTSGRKELMMFDVIREEHVKEIASEIHDLYDSISEGKHIEFVVNPEIRRTEFNASAPLATLISQLWVMSDGPSAYPASVVKASIQKNTMQHVLFRGCYTGTWRSYNGTEKKSFGQSVTDDTNSLDGSVQATAATIKQRMLKHLSRNMTYSESSYCTMAYLSREEAALHILYPGVTRNSCRGAYSDTNKRSQLLHAIGELEDIDILREAPANRHMSTNLSHVREYAEFYGGVGLRVPHLTSLITIAESTRLSESGTDYRNLILTPHSIPLPGLWDNMEVTSASHNGITAAISPVITAYLGCMSAATTSLLPINYERVDFKKVHFNFGLLTQDADTLTPGTVAEIYNFIYTVISLFVRASDRDEPHFGAEAMAHSSVKSGLFRYVSTAPERYDIEPTDETAEAVMKIWLDICALKPGTANRTRVSLAMLSEIISARLGTRVGGSDTNLEVALNISAMVTLVREASKVHLSRTVFPRASATSQVLFSGFREHLFETVSMRWGLPQGAKTSSFLSASISEILLRTVKEEYAKYEKRVPVKNFDVLVYSDNLYVVYDLDEGVSEKGHTIVKRIVDASIKKVGLFVNSKKTQLFDGNKKILGLLIDRKGNIRVPRSRVYEINQIALNLAKSEHGEVMYKGHLYTTESMSRLTGLREWAKNVGRKDYSQTVFTVESVSDGQDGKTVVTLSKGDVNKVLVKRPRRKDGNKDTASSEA